MTYEELLATFNHQMLAGHDDRVPFLASIRDAFGQPDRSYHVIHIAGTNGKGSTGSVIVNTLRAAGYHVGYFSSPALLDECEMIRVDGQLIAKADFVETYQELVDQLPANVQAADLTVFEWWTMIALQFFKDQHVDWAVIECGMGGEDDATNVIGAPDLAVITHLALDHTDVLGPKIEDIACSASGIIKDGTGACVLAGQQDPSAEEVVKSVCHFHIVPLIDSGSQVQVNLAQQHFDATKGMPLIVNGGHFNHLSLTTHLLGTYQLANLTTAATICDWLIEHQVMSNADAFVKAAESTIMPARLQMIESQPPTFLDAAHNPDGASALLDSCQQCFAGRSLIFVLGFLADKDWQKMAEMYRRVAKSIITTTPNNPKRTLTATELASNLPGSQAIDDPKEALLKAQQLAGAKDAIIATGSFYLVKELLPEVTSGQTSSHLDQRSSY